MIEQNGHNQSKRSEKSENFDFSEYRGNFAEIFFAYEYGK
jgi:hypothetical protein